MLWFGWDIPHGFATTHFQFMENACTHRRRCKPHFIIYYLQSGKNILRPERQRVSELFMADAVACSVVCVTCGGVCDDTKKSKFISHLYW